MHLIAFVVRISMLDNLCIQLLETDWLDSKEITIEIVEQHWNMIKTFYSFFFKKAAPLILSMSLFISEKYLLTFFQKKAPPLRCLWRSVQYQFPILKVEQHPFPVSQINSFTIAILTCSDLLFAKSTCMFHCFLCVRKFCHNRSSWMISSQFSS